MDDFGTQDGTEPARWLLMIHQLPAKPAYLRVKIWRRLQALGAVTVKNSVYALPADEQTREDFEWLLKEIVDGGGEALICEARLIAGLSDPDLRTMFNAARDAEYDALAKEARELGERLSGETDTTTRADARARLPKLKAELARIVAIDVFGANGRETVDGLLATLGAQLQEDGPMKA
ncbi:MAG: ChrB protein, partial [Pseudomonadota bacterium]|nr:ChrB protein [Pseudomonadota bacterium]